MRVRDSEAAVKSCFWNKTYKRRGSYEQALKSLPYKVCVPYILREFMRITSSFMCSYCSTAPVGTHQYSSRLVILMVCLRNGVNVRRRGWVEDVVCVLRAGIVVSVID